MSVTVRYLQWCLSVFILCFLALDHIYATPAGGKSEEIKLFVTFAALGPPFSFLLWLATVRFQLAPLGSPIASLIALGAVAVMFHGQYPSAMFLTAVAFLFLFVAALVVNNKNDRNLNQSIVRSVLCCNSLMLPLLFLAWSLRNIGTLLYDKLHSTQPWTFHHSGTRFAIGFIAGSLLLVVAATYPPTRTSAKHYKWSTPIAVSAAFFIASMFFDPSLHLIFDAYAPYIGPALRVAHGRVPLIDNVSQYGMNYLLFVPAILAGWPATALAAIVSLSNVLLYFAFLCAAIKLARRKSVAVGLGCVFLLFAAASYSYNPVLTPSVLGFRFLPLYLLLLSLSGLPVGRYFTPTSVAVLWLSLLWSAEAAVFSLAIYGTFLAVIVLGCALDRREIIGLSIRILLTVSSPYLILVVTYKFAVGDLPHLRPYFEMLSSFAQTEIPSADWYVLIDRSIGIYMLLSAAYACAISLAAFQVWCSRTRDDSAAERVRWAVVAAAGTMGFSVLSYYIGRSTNPAITFLALPFFLLLILAIDALIGYFRQQGCALSIRTVPEALFALLLVPLASGVGFDIFFGPSHPLYGNSTLLRTGISSFVDLRTALNAPPYSPVEHLLSPDAVNSATLIRRLEPSAREVLIFAREPVATLFHTGKMDGLGISNPANDMRSHTFAKATEQRAATVDAGQIVYVSRAEPLFPMQLEILDIFRTNWRLCMVDQAGDVVAYRLTPRSIPCIGGEFPSGDSPKLP